ncbi:MULTISPECIES: SpaA isopeptide-forming pilin-related protein [Bacillus]|uniref:SpaA isopeptide-forming pilin-related protein n=1 Tax=Bacillus TaxID=1386 RepID=UPI000304408F|nr:MULTISPECIES: SpaA isopeptide-forming pilin-related protein [Bacillus]
MKKKFAIVVMAFFLISQSFFGMTPISYAQDGDQISLTDDQVQQEQPTNIDQIDITDEKDINEQIDSNLDDKESIDINKEKVEDQTNQKEPSNTDSKVLELDKKNVKVATESKSVTDEKDQKQNVVKMASEQIKENLITSVVMKDKDGNNITTIRPDQGSRVQIDFTWELISGHSYKAGDTFTFNLPEKFKLTSKLNGDLSGEVGTYEVTPEGKVTFTFNEKINGGQGLEKGYFTIWRDFDSGKFSGGLQQPIDFTFGGSVTTIPVHFKGKGDEMKKTGTANKKMNPNEIEWVVDFNKGEKSIKDATFKDYFQDIKTEDLQIIKDSIKVYELTVKLDGSVVPSTDAVNVTPNLLTNENGFEIAFGDIDKAYRVIYTTNVKPIIVEPYTKTYTNKATITGKENDKPITMDDSTSVNVNFSKPLSKSSTGYNSSTQTITWEIQYNYNEQSIEKNNAWIKDYFDKNHQEFLPSSLVVYNVKINDDGTTVTGSEVPQSEYTVDKDASHGFVLNFNKDINSAYKIVYQTKAINRVHEDQYTVKNNVEIYDGTKTEAKRDINQVIFKKNRGQVDYAKKTIEWKINLNDDNKEMNDVVITDSYKDKNLKLDPNSLVIQTGTTILEAGKDYKLVENPEYNEGFKITFLKPLTSSHVLTYKTEFDPTKKIPNGGYKNNATLNWTENGIKQTSISKSATLDPDNYTKNNGNKTGKYNAQTKEITWTIDVNYNLYEVNNAIIRDFYTGIQTFVPDSLQVYELELTGSNDGVKVGNLVSKENYTLTQPLQNAEKNDGFELKLGKINKAYRITYKTSLKNQTVKAEYKNHATMQDGDQGVNLFDQSATVNPKHGGEYINKEGKQGTGVESDLALWTININRSQSTIEAGAKLTDTLSANQILINKSFELYAATVAENGTLTKGALVDPSDYILEFATVNGQNTFTLTFKKEVTSAFFLQYKSFINANHNETISNNASFAGQFDGVIDKSDNESFQADFQGAGGGASIAGKGDFTIVKVDADNNKKALAGATFELYDKSGTMLLETVTTDENGKAVFKDYKYKTYKLKEVFAPSGYVISQDYKSGKEIIFSKDTATLTIENKELRQGFELTKVDDKDNNKKLEGASFTLQYDAGDGYKGDEVLTTGADGKLAKGNLKPGKYQLVEQKAPKGYQLDKTPITFTIGEEQTEILQLTAKNEIYVGSIELEKKDLFDQTPLPGAKFDIQDADGNTVKTGLVTGQDGKLKSTGLAAGIYYLVEIAAPADYVLDSTPIKFEIINDVPLKLTVTNKLIPGSVKLTKVSSENKDIKLKDAEFKLIDENNKIVKDSSGKELIGLVTDKDGELVVKDLNPGKYYFVETKAPAGYLLDSKPIAFEIKKNQEPEEHVEVTKENTLIPPAILLTGSVKLVKVEKGNLSLKLKGAEFSLLNENDQIVKDQAGKELKDLSTNENGELVVKDLSPGKYKFVETKAPFGYQLDSAPMVFEIKASYTEHDYVELQAENQLILGSVQLTKVKAGNHNVKLKGAEFSLLNENKKIVKNQSNQELAGLTTDESGQLIIENLKPGKYQFVETKAPTGYILNSKPIEFEIKSNQAIGEHTIVVFENEVKTNDPNNPNNPNDSDPNNSGKPNGTDGSSQTGNHSNQQTIDRDNDSKHESGKSLPKTGEASNTSTIVAGIVLILIGFVIMFNRRRTKA